MECEDQCQWCCVMHGCVCLSKALVVSAIQKIRQTKDHAGYVSWRQVQRETHRQAGLK